MPDYTVPDMAGWEAFCGVFREMRRCKEWDTKTREEYREFVCTTCHSILITLQRGSTRERLNEANVN